MNKEQYIENLNSLDLPKDEYYILGSGSLLMYGIREIANDIDLCVSLELFDYLNKEGIIDIDSENECGFYKLNDLVEVVANDKESFEYDLVDGYQVEKLEKILKFKENRNKEKDQVDIVKIREYINLNKNV